MNILEQLQGINNIPINMNEIHWRISKNDINFFKSCITEFKKHDIKNVLDIATGEGEFVKMCLDNNIDAYGIDPFNNPHERIFKGTFSTAIEHLKSINVMFDCITVHNTLHGKQIMSEKLLMDLSTLFITKSKYIIISLPYWELYGKNKKERNELKEKCNIKRFKKIHKFKKSHGGAHHWLFEIL